MKEIIQKVKDSASAVSEKVKESAGSVTDKFKEIKEEFWSEEQKQILEEFKDRKSDKIKEIVTNLTNASPLIEKAGFKQEGFSIIMGLPPEIKLGFSVVRKIASEERFSIMEEVKENKLMELILNCLFKANDYCDKIQLGEHNMELIEITLGIIPGIEIHMKK